MQIGFSRLTTGKARLRTGETDSGYPKCGMLMDPTHKDFDHYTVMWAEWLESIRKDVECVFGILKQRFRWLRNKVMLTSQ
jgi:hypothetical protein